MQKLLASLAAVLALAVSALPAAADEAAIRKAVAERLPTFPKIDEVQKTPIPGIYELRFGTEILYSDEEGNHIFMGNPTNGNVNVIETKSGTNLTEDRIAKLTAVDFSKLPLKDAIVWKQGTGARKLVVFADPNCVYCKRFERDLQQVKDVTVYTFLYPILGGDSPDKAKAIWCAKDATKVWREWMISGTPIPSASPCDTTVLQRNVALGRKHRITGTPGLVFEDGTQKPGAMSAAQIEQLLATRSKG
jgi:thiol:disulfide interchange protein DsbC